MLGFAVFSVLIGCIVVPIIYIVKTIITKLISVFNVYWQPDGNRENINQSEPDQEALLKSHGYEIGDKIGQGTYADVKRAYSINNQKHVAVKIVNKLEVKYHNIQDRRT